MPDSNEPLAVSRAVIAGAILASSPVTRLALACRSDQLREQAADDLAAEIVEQLSASHDQLALAL